jgi:hypothetical protein
MSEYNQYRNQQRAVCKGTTAKGREDRQQTLTRLKQRKKEIRALAQPWPAKKILLSEAVAASVIELRTLKMSTQKTRQAQFPKNLRTWVAERAAEGDARASGTIAWLALCGSAKPTAAGRLARSQCTASEPRNAG